MIIPRHEWVINRAGFQPDFEKSTSQKSPWCHTLRNSGLMCGEQKYQVYAYRVVFIGMGLSTEKKKNGLGSVNFFMGSCTIAGLGMLAALLQN